MKIMIFSSVFIIIKVKRKMKLMYYLLLIKCVLLVSADYEILTKVNYLKL